MLGRNNIYSFPYPYSYMSDEQINLPADGTAAPASSKTATLQEEPRAEDPTMESVETPEESENTTAETEANADGTTGDVEEIGTREAVEAPGESEEADASPAAAEAEGVDSAGESEEVGEEAASAEAPVVDEAEASRLDDEAIFEQALGRDIRVFKENEMVEGTVVGVDIEGALVDIGFKSEALIPANELSIKKNVDPRDVVAVGDQWKGWCSPVRMRTAARSSPRRGHSTSGPGARWKKSTGRASRSRGPSSKS